MKRNRLMVKDNAVQELKPSDILDAIISGVQRYSASPDFIIDTNLYGDAIEDQSGKIICVGCVATCAVQELWGIDFKPSTICNRPESIGANSAMLCLIEQLFDFFRQGFGFHNIMRIVDLLNNNYHDEGWEHKIPDSIIIRADGLGFYQECYCQDDMPRLQFLDDVLWMSSELKKINL